MKNVILNQVAYNTGHRLQPHEIDNFILCGSKNAKKYLPSAMTFNAEEEVLAAYMMKKYRHIFIRSAKGRNEMDIETKRGNCSLLIQYAASYCFSANERGREASLNKIMKVIEPWVTDILSAQEYTPEKISETSGYIRCSLEQIIVPTNYCEMTRRGMTASIADNPWLSAQFG